MEEIIDKQLSKVISKMEGQDGPRAPEESVQPASPSIEGSVRPTYQSTEVAGNTAKRADPRFLSLGQMFKVLSQGLQ